MYKNWLKGGVTQKIEKYGKERNEEETQFWEMKTKRMSFKDE